MHMYKKCDFVTKIFKKNFRLLQFLSNFYHCFKAAANTNTIFHYGKNCARRFVNHKYSNFLGTVPTFGFRISIVENVRSQNFMKNWLSEVQKFYRIRLLFEFATYLYLWDSALVVYEYHRRTVHRGRGGPGPPQFFWKLADGPPQLFLKNNRLLDGPLKLVTLL